MALNLSSLTKSKSTDLSALVIPNWKKPVLASGNEYTSSLEIGWKPYADIVPKEVLRTVFEMESSSGTNKANELNDLGKFGWLTGQTKTGHGQQALQSIKGGIDPTKYKFTQVPGWEDLSTPEAAFAVTAGTLARLKMDNPDASWEDIYFKYYNANKDVDTPQRRQQFKELLGTLGQDLKLEQGTFENKDWYDEITSKIRNFTKNIPIVNNLTDVIFGVGKEKYSEITGERPEVTSGMGADVSLGDQMLMKGLVGTFGLDFLTRTQQEKITLAERKLLKNGATEDQALRLSTQWATSNAEERQKLKESLPNNLKNALSSREVAEGFGVLIDAVGIIPMGWISKSATPGVKLFLKNADDIGDIARKLKQLGVADDLITEYAPLFAKAKTTKEVELTLRAMDKLQETTKVGKVVSKGDDILDIAKSFDSKLISNIDEANPLIKEARKYKSADEFVKAQPVVYHGTTELASKNIESKGFNIGKGEIHPGSHYGEGVYLTNVDYIAEEYAGKSGKVIEAYIAPDANILTVNSKKLDKLNKKLGQKYYTSEIEIGNTPFNTKIVSDKLKKEGYDGLKIYFPDEGVSDFVIFDSKNVKTKSQLTDIYNQAVKGVPERLPAVIQGETFTLGSTETIQPTFKELQKSQKAQIKATKQELKNAQIAAEKAQKLELYQQKIRKEAIENVNRYRGNVENIVSELKGKGLSEEDIANIVLEDGTKLEDVVKVKRNADKSLSTYITKKEIDDIAKTYTDEIPKQKWEKRSMLVDGVEVPVRAAKSIELPYLYFERKGLSEIYDPIVKAGRDAEIQKQLFLKEFEKEGLFKRGSWFTADRFTLSKSESEAVGTYYLGRQGKTAEVALDTLPKKSQKFIETFDNVIKQTEERFYDLAKSLGKNPGKIENYAPLMTSKDIKLVDEGGAMDWLFRNHPAFFSLKERVKNAPLDVYELDYRQVAQRWLEGITDFLNYGETTNHLKYLVNSDQFKTIVKEEDYQLIAKWLQDITTYDKPVTMGGKALSSTSRFFRKGVAMGALGLNYASVAKQALTQIPITLIEKAPPKLKSKYAEAFGIITRDLPSVSKRAGDIAIQDLQGAIGRIFTGALTKFDKMNAQASLNALLDKEYFKFLKEGVEITPDIQKIIEKNAQDALDMWYGGFFKGQRPEAFRKELGNFILMFTYPLTSQLNGFYRTIAKAKGWSKIEKTAEVLAGITAIAYMEQVIENLTFQWSDEQGMTKDVLLSLTGNIPVAGNIAYSIANNTEFSVSPALGNISKLLSSLTKDDKEKTAWLIAETFGLPKQIRRIKEGMQILEDGGITDSDGKMLAPVQDTIEYIRSFLRGKYGSMAAQDWIRNIGEKSEDRRWFVPEVEFLQNGDYARKAELYLSFDKDAQEELRNFLSEAQQKKLDNALDKRKSMSGNLQSIFK